MNPDLNLYWILLDVSVPPPPQPPKKKKKKTKGGFFWGKKADMPQVTDELDHIMLYRVNLTMSGKQTHNLKFYM
jgi:hypothetical protein